MRCPRCGAELRPDAAYCDRCGTPTIRSRPSRARVAVVMVLAVALFVVLAMIGLRGLLGSGDDRHAGDGAVATGGASGTSGGVTTGAPGVPTSGASVGLPAVARECAAASGTARLAAYAGTKDTSCAFATAVRDGYVKAAPTGGAATFQAYSSVTHTSYTVTCAATTPVRCTGGRQAVIYLVAP